MRWNCKFCRYCEYLFAIGNRSPCYDCKKGSNFELSKIYGVKTEQSYKPMTNGDRIRAMSDEEMAVWLNSFGTICAICSENTFVCDDETIACGRCNVGITNWLKQPAEDK